MLNCYKVVVNRNGSLYSSSAGETARLSSEWCVEYIPGKKARPKVKDTSLFVFKTYAAAKRFSDSSNEIWSCVVENPKRIVLAYSCRESTLKAFWEAKLAGRREYLNFKRTIDKYDNLYHGLAVSSVKLIERIS